ncbi:MAG TPA: class I SAM-dependent methyltransferase [bacterium]|nr:class I SAM-dependent methyltransferase [bacterium]HPN42504.1 class I SAM-dependent methyltransferase [bacterium]
MKIILKPQHEHIVKRRHPWIFSGAIARSEGEPGFGETVDILSAKNEWLARGAWSPHSQIRLRVWSFNPDDAINAGFLKAKLDRSISCRREILASGAASACRLVNAEADGLPGLIVDRYNEFLVCQFLAAGVVYWQESIIQLLHELLPDIAGIYERSDAEVRAREGLESKCGLLWGSAPPETLEIQEGPLRFLVDVSNGHKTGFYLDQRENRAALAEFCKGKQVLNCFSYTGGFGLWALYGGAAQVTNIDSSAPALELLRRNVQLNGFAAERTTLREADVFTYLRTCRDSRQEFDVIILDPPKFAQSERQMDKAARAYKDINLLALKLLRPGGILFTFSCSGHIGRDLFQKIIAGATLDSGRDVHIIRQLGQAGDHPIALNFPEGEYLKGLVCRVW